MYLYYVYILFYIFFRIFVTDETAALLYSFLRKGERQEDVKEI